MNKEKKMTGCRMEVESPVRPTPSAVVNPDGGCNLATVPDLQRTAGTNDEQSFSCLQRLIFILFIINVFLFFETITACW